MKKHYTVYTANKKNKLKPIYKNLQLNNIPIIKMKQTHSNIIHTITEKPNQSLITITNTDGLITSLKNVGLAIKFADFARVGHFGDTGAVGNSAHGRKHASPLMGMLRDLPQMSSRESLPINASM